MSGQPKYIKPTDKINEIKEDPREKIVYSFRIERQKINNMHIISDNLNINTNELILQVIDDFLKDKIIANDYINTKPIYINIPLNYEVKQHLTLDLNKVSKYLIIDHDLKEVGIESLSEYTSEYDADIYKINEDSNINRTPGHTNLFRLNNVPNNCDIFQKDINSYAMDGNKNKHHGIEIYINVESLNEDINSITTPNAPFNKAKFKDCLYFLYCIYDEKTEKTDINLINFISALNLSKKYNTELNRRIENIIIDLNSCETIEEVIYLAEQTNTDNLINMDKPNNEFLKGYTAVSVPNDEPYICLSVREFERKLKESEDKIKKETLEEFNKILEDHRF